MATGLEVLGAVSSSIELVKAAKSCLYVFNSLRHVESLSKEQKEVHFRIVAQGLKFERWCATLGIQDMIDLEESNPKWEETNGFSHFKEVMKSELHFKNDDMARMTLDIVRSMRLKIDEAGKILFKYAEATPGAPRESEPKKRHLGWPRFSQRAKSQSSRSEDDTLKTLPAPRGTSAMPLSLAARWISSDKNTVHGLLVNIEYLNKSLVDFLPPQLQQQVGRRTNMAILSNADYHMLAVSQGLPDGNDLGALASMKRWHIREQHDSQDDSVSNKSSMTLTSEASMGTRVHTYPVQDFKRGSLRLGDSRSLSSVDGDPVVIEWKYFSKEHPFRFEQSIRLASLVNILNRESLFDKFLALPCKGLVSDTDNSRIGLVFAVGQPKMTEAETLQGMIRREQTPPPIGERFGLARRFSLCLSYLHSVKWLHKSIRSDNFICFREISPKDPPSQVKRLAGGLEVETDDIVQVGSSASHTGGRLAEAPSPLPTFYLLGWDLSRPDHPSELSETLSVSTLGFQTKRDTIQMYSHPQAAADSKAAKARPRYRPQFDIYSLGLVLLEIGLWRGLDTIRYRCKDDEEFRYRVRTEYCDKLQSRMGLIYWRAVQRCLNTDFGVDNEHSSSEEEYPMQEAFEKHVVSELERCCA